MPMDDNNSVLENHSVIVNHGKIIDILPNKETRARYSANHTHCLEHHVVMPGLINTHTHSPMSLYRGLADDLPLMTWLNDHIWPAEGRTVSAEMVKCGMMLAAAEYIKGGITCINDMYFFAQNSAEVMHTVGLRGRVGNSVLNVPTPWAKDVDACFKQIDLAIDAVKALPLVDTTICPHAPYTTDPEILGRVIEVAQKHNIPIHIHVAETETEEQQCLDSFGKRPIPYLADLGVFDCHTMAAHMVHVNEDDIAIAAKYNVHALHCPESNMKLASGASPVQAMLDAGVNVSLATDGAASNNDLDMFGEMRSAAFLGKLSTGSPESISATTALRMSTVNGAKTMGYDHIGTLAKDKAADIIAVDLSNHHTQPLYHVPAQLVYASHAGQVTDTWVNGKQLLKNRELTTIDTNALTAEVEHWADKIRC